jgi:hypothetical protein
MEQRKFTHLDEFFSAAKASEESLITKEDIRAVLEEEDPMQSHSQHNTRIYQRKGFIMSTVGFIAASAVLVGYLGFQGDKQLAVSNEQLAIKPLEHTLGVRAGNDVTPQGEPKVTKKTIIINDDENTTSEIPQVPEPPAAPIPPLPPDGNLTSPVKVMGVAIYRASEEELKKLAIEEKKGTGLGFVVKVGKDNFEKFFIPEKGWGVIMNDEKVEKPEKYFEPVVVTDAQGNKRMINFSDDSSVMQYRKYKGNRAASMYVHGSGGNVEIGNGSVRVTNVDPHDTSAHIKEGTLMQVEDEESNMVLDNGGDSAKHNHTRIIKRRISIDSPDSSGNEANINIQALVEEAMKKAKESLKYSKYALDSAKEISVRLKIDGTDSLLDNISKDKMHEMRIMIDSLMRPEHMKEMAKQGKVKGMIIVKDKDSRAGATNISIDRELPELPALDEGMKKMEAKITAKLNSLVPILVRKATETTHNDKENRDYDNGVIMWFEPTKEFQSVVKAQPVQFVIDGVIDENDQKSQDKPPVEKQNIQSVRALENVTVYPNPAHTKTTVHFVTSEPRAVAFSVHDISGKKIIDGGSIAERPAGEYDFELNLEKLPPGLYLIVMTTDHGEQSIQRVVVEK